MKLGRLSCGLQLSAVVVMLVGCATGGGISPPDGPKASVQAKASENASATEVESTQDRIEHEKRRWSDQLDANTAALKKHQVSLTPESLASSVWRKSARSEILATIGLLQERIRITYELPSALQKIADAQAPNQDPYLMNYMSGISLANSLSTDVYRARQQEYEYEIRLIDLANGQQSGPKFEDGRLQWATQEAARDADNLLAGISAQEQKVANLQRQMRNGSRTSPATK